METRTLVAGPCLLIVLFIVWIAVSNASGPLLACMWVITLGCLLVSAASLVDWVSIRVGKNSLVTGIIFLFIVIAIQSNTLQQMVFPLCGDGICGKDECATCSLDCGPADCKDGICQEIENCETSTDCYCFAGTTCDLERAGDARGCTNIICGDSFCDKPESPSTCCNDCGCLSGYFCDDNICFFKPPQISFVPYIANQNLSALSLAANPTLTNASGHPHPFVTMIMKNAVSTAFNVSVSLVAGPIEKHVYLGTVGAGAERPLLWYVQNNPLFLNITEDTQTNITVSVSYTDSQEVLHTPQWVYPFTITSRNTLDKYGSIVFFVTPDDVTVSSNDPAQIWKMFSDILVTKPTKTIQFPLETREKETGSQTDIAVLLASAFYAAGIETMLVESKHGTYVRIRERDSYVMLDPSLIASRYEQAKTSKPGYSVLELDRIWKERNATVLSLK